MKKCLTKPYKRVILRSKEVIKTSFNVKIILATETASADTERRIDMSAFQNTATDIGAETADGKKGRAAENPPVSLDAASLTGAGHPPVSLSAASLTGAGHPPVSLDAASFAGAGHPPVGLSAAA